MGNFQAILAEDQKVKFWRYNYYVMSTFPKLFLPSTAPTLKMFEVGVTVSF